MNSEIAKQRLSEVVRIDTITSSYGDFMATHVPFRQIQLQKEYDSSAVSKTYTEEQIYKKVVLNPKDQHQFVLVIGSSGAGKSHLIRWFDAKIEKQRPESEVVLFVRRSDNTLKGTIKQLLEKPEVASIQNKELYERLVNATSTISESKLMNAIYHQFIAEIEDDNGEAVDYINNADRKRIAPLLNNELFKARRMMADDGPIARIYSKVAESSTLDNRDVVPEFLPEDFLVDIAFCDKVEHDGGDKKAVRLLEKMYTEPEVAELCDRFSMDFHEMSSWYDGYRFATFRHIYNPQSVVEAMRRHKFSNYWTSTETYEALKVYMDMDFDGLKSDIVHMLGGGRIRINTRSFQNDMCTFNTKDDVLTLLVHLGYLGYAHETEEAFIPNREIVREFENAMSVGGWPEIMRVLRASEKLLADTLSGDGESVAAGLDRAHTQVASILTYNDENSLACAIGLAYYSARKDYRLIRELPTGRGFADLVFLPLPSSDKPALVVELKYNRTAKAALEQIKERNYTQALEGYTGEILLVGINYEKGKKEKPHSCVIERITKQGFSVSG